MVVDERFDLESAIAAGRLSLFFQPRVAGPRREMVGVEGLLRWRCDQRGWIGVHAISELSADEFTMLWRWELEQVERAFQALRTAGLIHDSPAARKFFISLNLSYKQLQDDAWAQQVLDLLRRTRTPGCYLEVELTEQGTAADDMLTLSAFERLRGAGVAIALDDFPEGGASMLRLAQIRFDKVKIDRCMVPQYRDSMSIWTNKRAILSDLIAMIGRAGAEVVIEGVEQDAQFHFLSALPVSEWQGFLWGGAVPLEQIVARACRERTAGCELAI